MGSFNRGDRFSPRSNDRGRGRDRDRSSRPEMHEAVCAECGKRCEVPFRPSSDKPVYCSDCFEKRDSGGRFDKRSDSRRPERRSFDRSDRSDSRRDKPMVRVVCDNCHKECEVPFKPSGDKPVYCDECFSKIGRGDRGSRNNQGDRFSHGDHNHSNVNEIEIEQYKKHFSVLDSKLDEVLKMLSALTGKPIAKIVEKNIEIKPKLEPKKIVEVKKVIDLKKTIKTKIEPKKTIVKKSPVSSKIESKKSIKKVIIKKKK